MGTKLRDRVGVVVWPPHSVSAVFLASDDAGLMTSQTLVVDAGRKLW